MALPYLIEPVRMIYCSIYVRLHNTAPIIQLSDYLRAVSLSLYISIHVYSNVDKFAKITVIEIIR